MPNESHTRDTTEFDGKRVLVTGGTRGIGEAIVNRLAGGGATVIATAAQAQTLTFDNLPARTVIPNGYGGLNWSNFEVIDGIAEPSNGYHNGTISPNNVAFNSFGNPADLTSATPFTLSSGYFTAAWNNGLSLEVQGFAGASLLYDHTYILNTASPQLLSFNFIGITDAHFISSGGTNPGLSGSGIQFAMDNLTIGSVPEPSTMALTGLGAIAGLFFRRRK